MVNTIEDPKHSVIENKRNSLLIENIVLLTRKAISFVLGAFQVYGNVKTVRNPG